MNFIYKNWQMNLMLFCKIFDYLSINITYVILCEIYAEG